MFIMEITKDMIIGELLNQKPEAAEILLNMGMHCLGCPSARSETIGQACEVHGVDADEIIEQINAL